MSNLITKENIHPILKSYFHNRFQGLSPSNFEKVVEVLLDQKFDTAKQTKKTGDFGADVLAKNGNERIVVEVKRYNKSNKVGNQLVNNLIGAKDYYQCQKGIFITTSDFTKAAKIIAEKSNIELWNWNKLTQEISTIFWSGKNYYEYYSDIKELNEQKNRLKGVEIELEKIEYSFTDKQQSVNWIYVNFKNLTEEIITLSLIDIKVLSHDSKQFDIDGFQTGYFRSGDIFPSAIATCSFFLNQAKAGRIKIGAKVILTIVKQGQNELITKKFVLEIDDKVLKRSAASSEINDEDLSPASTFIFYLVIIISLIFILIGLFSSY